MEGTLIIKKRRTGTNYSTGLYTAEYYNGACAEIQSAQHRSLAGQQKEVIVTHSKGAGNVLSLIINVLKSDSNIDVKSSTAWANSSKKTLLKFDTKQDAEDAARIINEMSGDSINEDNVNYHGEVTTNHGLQVKIQMTTDNDGNKVPASGGAYTNKLSTSTSTSTTEDKTGGTSTDNSNWIIYGVIALFVIAIVLVILKKKHIIK